MEPVTDRIRRKAEKLPEWLKWLGGCAVGAVSSAVTIGIMIGASQARLTATELRGNENSVRVEKNRDDIVELRTRVEATDARAEERHQAVMRALLSIEKRLDR